MTHKKAKFLQISGALMCVLAILMCMINFLALPAKAAQAELNIIAKQHDKGIEGVQWLLFRVGEKNGSVYMLTGDFAGYPVDLSKASTTSEVQNAANTLANYAKLDKLKALSEAASDENGSAVLTGVGEGIFLVVGSEVIVENKKFIPASMLTEFSEDQLKSGNINIYAKFSTEDITAETSEYGVEKIWLNAETRTLPESISVEIYKDNVLAETVTLNKENGWKYYWTGDSRAVWNVKETEIPDGCTVIYKEAGTVFRIENTYTDDSSLPDGYDSGSSDIHTPDDSSNKDSATNSDNSGEIITSEADSHKPQGDSSNTEQITSEDNSSSKSSAVSSRDSSKPNDSKSDSVTGTGTGTGTGGGTTNTSLPQTGSLWWPVPIMAGAGLLLMAAGLRVSRKKGN